MPMIGQRLHQVAKPDVNKDKKEWRPLEEEVGQGMEDRMKQRGPSLRLKPIGSLHRQELTPSTMKEMVVGKSEMWMDNRSRIA